MPLAYLTLLHAYWQHLNVSTGTSKAYKLMQSQGTWKQYLLKGFATTYCTGEYQCVRWHMAHFKYRSGPFSNIIH